MQAEILSFIERLQRKAELFAFPETIDRLRRLFLEREIVPQALISFLLLDQALVVRLLRSANSAFFNPTGLPLTTVSRAIVVLGLNNVKQIVLGTPLLTPSQEREPLFLREVAHSLVAAYLAREAAAEKFLNPEEVYLAAFLRRVGREILVLNAPELYRALLARPESEQTALAGKMAKSFLSSWNLPHTFTKTVEGQPLGPYPSNFKKVLALSEQIARDLLAQKPLKDLKHLFEGAEAFHQALERLREDFTLLPLPVAEYLAKVLPDTRATFKEEAEKAEKHRESSLPAGELSLLQKILTILTAELGCPGGIAWKKEGHWVVEGQGEISEDLSRLHFAEILAEEGPVEFVVRGHRILALPFQVRRNPAGMLLFWRRGVFSQEEYAGLKLLQKVLNRLLRHF